MFNARRADDHPIPAMRTGPAPSCLALETCRLRALPIVQRAPPRDYRLGRLWHARALECLTFGSDSARVLGIPCPRQLLLIARRHWSTAGDVRLSGESALSGW